MNSFIFEFFLFEDFCLEDFARLREDKTIWSERARYRTQEVVIYISKRVYHYTTSKYIKSTVDKVIYVARISRTQA